MRNHHALPCCLLMLALASSGAIAQAGLPFAATGDHYRSRSISRGRKSTRPCGASSSKTSTSAPTAASMPRWSRTAASNFPSDDGLDQDHPSNAKGDVIHRDRVPLRSRADPHYLRVESKADAQFGRRQRRLPRHGRREGEDYDFSAQVRDVAGDARFAVRLYGADGSHAGLHHRCRASRPIGRRYQATLQPNATDPKASLYVLVRGPRHARSRLWSRCSRRHTWKNRPGGLRADMVQMLADMKPGFLRFPGGCIVEGSDLSTAIPVEEHHRPGRRPQAPHQPLEQRIHLTGPRPTTSSRSAWASTSSSSSAKTSAPSPADPQLRHGLPVQHGRTLPRSTNSSPTSRTRWI